MASPNKKSNGIPKRSDNGFALIASLLAIWILTAVGVLVFVLTTRDVRVSSRVVGEKKAFSAAEAGVHRMTQNFDPVSPSASVTPGPLPVDPDYDLGSQYTIDTVGPPNHGPSAIPMVGYAISGGQQWGATRYVAGVTGTNTRYNSTAQIEIGVGYGPIEITTAYR
jgi:hypothetical protein